MTPEDQERFSGADPEDFRAAVSEQHAEALRSVGMEPMDDSALDRQIPDPPDEDTRPLSGSPSSHELFRKVVKAVRSDRSQLYGAYFVLVAAQSDRGTTARRLRHMGIDPNEIAGAARAEIDLLNNATP